MKFFLNSCEPDEIREIADWGILDGVTMNPTMVAAINRDYVKNIREILRIVPDREVFAQVVASKAEGIIEEAKALAGIDKNIVVKIHTNAEGTKAIRKLKESGIRTCATGIHSVIECLAMERAGADHVALFLGLLGEVDEHSTDALVADTRQAYDHASAKTKIMAAVRSVNQLVRGACYGADEMTAPYKIWKLFFQNPHTLNRWNAFATDWKKAYGDRNWITGY